MDARRWARLQEVFLEACSVPEEEQETLLASRCDGDAGMLEEVRSLLRANAQQGVLDVRLPLLTSVAEAVQESVPQRIGAYDVIREIGRGGMGVVYLAERADGQFQHRVAIKLIAATDADDPLRQRFLAERQILAGLRHPNIAQLLDGGITEDGRPYLVLEYVDGLPITAYCDRHRLSIEERLELFLDVCAAVQHAHQNLVIHRDLKPGNILVDADGRVHLLDFGIAKLLNPALSVASAPVTRVDVRLMTPEYASPEQVRGDSLTTASDIYSLGVLLYELLTGSAPYPLSGRSPADVLSAICELDPERPSTRVKRIDRFPSAEGATREITPERRSSARSTSVERLRGRLRGDLDGIVLMAMRKEPGRRYASADQLCQDIQRHLEGMPVLAHRGSRRYRVRNFLRRNRVHVAAVAAVVVSLLVGLGTALWQAGEARVARDRAEEALAQSGAVTDFLMELFRSGETDPEASADEVTALDLLRRGTARASELSDQPGVQARLLDVIGQMSLHLGRYDEAQRLLEHAVLLRRSLAEPDSLGLAESLLNLARVHRSRPDLARARPLAAEALEIRRRRLPPDHPLLAEAFYERGWLEGGEEQYRLYQEALGILQRSGAASERQVELLQALSTNLRRRGLDAEALAADREALRLAEREFGPEHFRTGYAMIHLGDHVRDLEEDPAAAEQLYRRGLAMMTRRFGERSLHLIHGLHSLGNLLSNRGEHHEAEQLYRRALEIRRSATGPEHPQVADGIRRLASALARQGRLREAEAMILEANEMTRRRLGSHHPAIASSLPVLAELYERQGRIEEADRAFREALELTASRGSGPGHVHRAYGRMLLRQNRLALAEQQLLQSLAVLERWHLDADHPDILETKRALMELYEQWKKPELVERFRVPPGRFVAH